MKIEKLVSAGMKAGGAAASGICAGLMIVIGGERLNNASLAVAGGLGVSAAILTKQAIGDVVDAFSSKEDE